MFKYINMLQIALSLQNISIKHINIKINFYLWKPGFKKGDNLNAIRTHPFIFSSRSYDRQSSDENFSSRGHDRQSSEQNNRKLISLHNNDENDKHAHGFVDF
jgi:hypothetical protein